MATVFHHFIAESNGKRIFKISQHLAKLWTNNYGCFLTHSLCIKDTDNRISSHTRKLIVFLICNNQFYFYLKESWTINVRLGIWFYWTSLYYFMNNMLWTCYDWVLYEYTVVIDGIARHSAACCMRWLHYNLHLTHTTLSVFSSRSSRESTRYVVRSFSMKHSDIHTYKHDG